MRLRWLIRVVFACSVSSLAVAQPRKHQLDSKVLNEQKSIRVALPANYSIATQKYPVVYLLDGHVEAFFDMAVAASRYGLSGDARDFAIPPQIVVAVEHRDRGSDLGRNADAFMKFLQTELVPFIEKTYRASPARVLIGHSLGGRFALLAACRAPGLFPSVVAVSPGGGDSTADRNTTECLKSDWKAHPDALRQIFISSGEREVRIDEGAKRLRDFLKDSAPANVRWKYIDGPDLSHTETPFVGIPAGIKFVYDRTVREMPAAQADSVLRGLGDVEAIVDRWYAELSKRVGYSVQTSAKWLGAVADAHVARGNFGAAALIAQAMIATYPEDLGGHGRLADIQLRTGQRAQARETLNRALKIVDALEFFDETERALKKKVFRDALTQLGANP
jgi:predicted alpha/beta superfamily hydrolase